ncbi:MAG: D-serine ammonia-lyase [Proteobacteria bacterium]|nr:D-serine ammonia-lyase [Pseudomonadota bacterium]
MSQAPVDKLQTLAALRTRQPLLWLNPGLGRAAEVLPVLSATHDMGMPQIVAADARLRRWGEALSILFPELAAAHGLIESPLLTMTAAQAVTGASLDGRFLIKADHALPVAGSIKARGGIFEVLVHAENLARKHGVLNAGDNPVGLLQPAVREMFGRHLVSVGSTGNLGLSIGIMAAALGFRAEVHMSHDAKEWKKTRLRKRGVGVVEHRGDYAAAVAAGREAASRSPSAYFVDDENSPNLFLGYAVAALRLKDQLAAAGIAVDAAHPLFVYLPCGVGGAPGGITFGFKHLFGDAVHCFFAEPCASPAMLVRMLSGDRPLSVYDVGLDNVTEADGLAVAQASELVYALVKSLVSGVYTVADESLFRVLYLLKESQNQQIEPSAAAAFLGLRFFDHGEGLAYTKRAAPSAADITHVFWTTGGSFVPPGEYARFADAGRIGVSEDCTDNR